MTKQKTIKTSSDVLKLEEEKKNQNYTFGFKHFETESKDSNEITFNNKFSSIIHFLKTNSDLFNSMKTISSENYKTTIIDKKLEAVMHFKLLEKDDSIERIHMILTEVFSKSENVVNQLMEGSQFVEFGMTDGCRYIGVLIDYHIIEILYLDPNHLTFPDYKFDVANKMSYTVPAIYNLKSDKYLNANTSSFSFNVDVNEILSKKYSEEKENESIQMILYIISELYDLNISDQEAISLLKEAEKERRNEK